jgi:hypothetical protein
VQYFDGDLYDLFVLSVGFHHFLTVVFGGQSGSRQFGAVTRFGRRAAEDLKALLGASAYLLDTPLPPPPAVLPEPVYEAPAEELVLEEPIARAEFWDEPEAIFVPEPEPEPVQLEAIEEFDPRILDGLRNLNADAADDLFDPERLAQIANENRRGRGPISYDEARELGIVP